MTNAQTVGVTDNLEMYRLLRSDVVNRHIVDKGRDKGDQFVFEAQLDRQPTKIF